MGHAASMRRVYDLINAGNIDGIGKTMAADVVEHEELPGISESGREAVLAFFRMFAAAFPDLHVDVDEVLESGDRAIARVRFSGTHEGEFMGMPPTGRRFSAQAIDIIRFGEDGLAREHWGVFDSLAMMAQLGAMEPPG